MIVKMDVRSDIRDTATLATSDGYVSISYSSSRYYDQQFFYLLPNCDALIVPELFTSMSRHCFCISFQYLNTVVFTAFSAVSALTNGVAARPDRDEQRDNRDSGLPAVYRVTKNCTL